MASHRHPQSLSSQWSDDAVKSDAELLSDGAVDADDDDEAYECEELYGVSTVMAGDGVGQSVAVDGDADVDVQSRDDSQA